MRAKQLTKAIIAAFAKETPLSDLKKVADTGKNVDLVEAAIEEINRRKIESDFQKVKEAFDSDQITADQFLEQLKKYNKKRLRAGGTNA